MYVRLMVPEPSMLELLRSRLTDLEARQRAAGGVAERGFWESFTGRMPSASSQPPAHSAGPAGRTAEAAGCAASASTEARERAGIGRPESAERLARAGAMARPVSPAARPKVRPSGPWADLAPEALDSLDLDRVQWLDEAGY